MIGTRPGFPNLSHKDIVPSLWRFPEMYPFIAGWFIMENALKMDDLGVALWPGKPPYVVAFNPNSQWNPIQPGLKKTASNVFIFRQKNYAKKKRFFIPRYFDLSYDHYLLCWWKQNKKITNIDNDTYIYNIDTINIFCDIMKMCSKKNIPLVAGPRPTSTAASARVPWPSPYRPWRVSRVASLGKRSRAAARRHPVKATLLVMAVTVCDIEAMAQSK